MKKPTAIITSDIGLQEGQPQCRLDDYFEAQARKIMWLNEMQQKYNCPILDGGDIFEHWKASPYLLQWAIKYLPNHIITVPGNHDLPAHNIDLLEKSGLAVLEGSGKVRVLKQPNLEFLQEDDHKWDNIGIVGFPWNVEPGAISELMDINVALVHTMCYNGRSPWPGCKDPSARSLLRAMSGFDLVIVGHNHKHFIVEHGNRKLISPGSLTRTTADQADYEPHIFLWFAETNEIEAIPVPIEKGVISREHIDAVANKDERIEAFVSKLTGDMEIGLSFEQNLDEFFRTNRVRKAVESMVWEACGR